MTWTITHLLYINGWLLTFLPSLVLCGRLNETSACLGLPTAASSYLQNNFGTSPVLTWANYDGRDLKICLPRTPGPTESCCSKPHEDTFLANAFKLISRFSPKTLSDVIVTQATKLSEQVRALLAKTKEKVRYRLSLTLRIPEHEYRSHLDRLFSQLSLSVTPSDSFLNPPVVNDDSPVASFFRDIFPSVFVHIGHSMDNFDFSRKFRRCIKSEYDNFDPRPYNTVPFVFGKQLSTVLKAYRFLLEALQVSSNLINSTTAALPSSACLEGLVRLRLCHLCSGQNVSRPCAGVCVNIHRGCFAHLLPLSRGWGEFVTSTRRLVDVILARHDLIMTLHSFDSTILKAIQKATHNVATYGPKLISQCHHAIDITNPDERANRSESRQTSKPPKVTSKPLQDVEISDAELQPRLNVIRSLLTNNQRFYDLLPDQYCKGLRSRNCWNGTHQSPIGYSRAVLNFTDAHQRVNPEVQMEAPVSFPVTEVENQNSKLLQSAKKLRKFIELKLNPRPPTRPPTWIFGGRRRLPSSSISRFEGSGSGHSLPTRTNRIPVDDEDNRRAVSTVGDFSGSGFGPYMRVPGTNYVPVTSPSHPPQSARGPIYAEAGNDSTSVEATKFLLVVILIFISAHRALTV